MSSSSSKLDSRSLMQELRSFDNEVPLFDFGHPLLNSVSNSFLKAAAIGAIQAASREAYFTAVEDARKACFPGSEASDNGGIIRGFAFLVSQKRGRNRVHMMSLLGKTRQVAVMEVEDDDGDLFGTSSDDEDFNLFENKSKSKLNKAKSISEASPPATPYQKQQQHHHPNSAAPVPTFANMNGISNQGYVQGVLNGSILLGHHNSITVYHHC